MEQKKKKRSRFFCFNSCCCWQPGFSWFNMEGRQWRERILVFSQALSVRVALFHNSVKKKKRRWTEKGLCGWWRRGGGSPHSLLKVIRLSRPGIRGNGGPTEEMVIPKAVTHRKGIHHPLDVCVCVCVYNDVIPSVPQALSY